MKFIKMHGIGNDYVYVNGFEEKVDDPPTMARAVSDRHFGIGSDGLILVLPPEDGVEADVRMRMFNADGSEAEMCGNGIRCVCKFAFDHGLTTAQPMKVQTGHGVLNLAYETNGDGKVAQVTVDMGEPVLELPQIPVDESKFDEAVDDLTFVSMGNPHAVLFIDEAEVDPNLYPPTPNVWAAQGSMIEDHPAFPNRINYHHVVIHTPSEVTVKHWERGSGATLACGTGACAVCVAGVLTGKTERKILAHLPGGDLTLEWKESDNHVYMTGPATEVFSGEWDG